ncbi:amidoligase family protein [Rufibacter tibetensis]|uniref:Amidoligase n=1 Tax=Rufibacter tibetensis TaxID=512763 RepID=A0A0N7HWW5_9BACT|nr:amidoligase family protein [Rufibacter tibetensis]ALJ00385.1 amidoligase [Rufibacter tibetensis]
MSFKPLPVERNQEGKVRTVGFELEFANVGIGECLQIVQDLYGGRVEMENRFSAKVVDTRIGSFSVEIDLKLLTEKQYKTLFDKLNIDIQSVKIGQDTLENMIDDALESVIQKVIPYEIGCPPLPYHQLEELEALRQALFEHHAKGTEAFFTNAFGTHINTEIPDTEPATILRYIRAFLLLYPWLLEAGETDFARRNLTSFINPFPDEYSQLVLDPSYAPGLEQLIDDYHQYNPDRNRPLDMYPLFAYVREEQVNSYTNLGSVKARKTFHYRLPNSCVSDPDWTLAQEWNNWVVIEELAANPDRIREMSLEFLNMKENTLLGFERKWCKQTEQWLTQTNRSTQ